MLEWLSENIGTIIVCAVLAAVLAAIIIHMVNNKRRGKTSCGCGCSNCAMSDSCHKK
ncbi:MAG: FeoB-associated Cys-rich membrane protein [Christensenellaceae bacterium]|nr:FeoB-associated Cys-rich membrane protein [Christensenellaceae bacterium]